MARVLFVCPTYPGTSGVGLAMRAGVSVDGLARRHDVSVAVVKHQDEDDDRDAAALAWTRDRVTAAIVVPHAVEAQAATSWLRTERGRAAAANPLPEFARRVPPALGDTIADELGTSFDVLMVMRTYLAGAAVPFLEEGLSAILDADDDDARTFESIGLLGEPEGKDAAKYSDFQRIVLPWFDRVLFASAEDALAPFEQLPNAVRVPPVWTMRAPADPLELLFVGNLGYPPNRDALDRLNARIVPAIADMGIDVRLHHPAPDDEIAPFYERAHIAVVPLRAGGGTSIKILEAFAHGCPVVASPTGARGLEVADDDQLVITDDDADDEGFASAVVALARDDRRRARLAATARRFVVEHHDATAVGDELARLIDEVAAIGSPNEYEA